MIDKNKYYLKDEEGAELNRPYKDYELMKIDKVEQIPEDVLEEQEHKRIKREKKIVKEHRKEGIEEKNISSRLRHRKPANQLVSDRYGKVVY